MSDAEPLFKVVRGAPTPEELAALVGVVMARSRQVAPPAPPSASAWMRSARPAAAGISAWRGPDAWRLSTLPG